MDITALPPGTVVIPHVHHLDDDWGMGQIKIDVILEMIEVGRESDLAFTFAKKVTALDDLDLLEDSITGPDYQTITASDDHLFVFPSRKALPCSFWEKVERKIKDKGDSK